MSSFVLYKNIIIYKKINVLSLFDGISCDQTALERVDISVDKYYASEIDKNIFKPLFEFRNKNINI